jgi:hypothetical protein
VKKTHWRGGKLYIVENVEAEVCPECGERYYHGVLLREYLIRDQLQKYEPQAPRD